MGEMEGDFVRPRRKSAGDRFLADHHTWWSEAVEEFVATRDAEQLPEGEYEVVLVASVSHSCPGWVDGYKVVLKPRG